MAYDIFYDCVSHWIQKMSCMFLNYRLTVVQVLPFKLQISCLSSCQQVAFQVANINFLLNPSFLLCYFKVVQLVRGTQRDVARVCLRGFVLFLRGVLPGDRGGELGRSIGGDGRRLHPFGAGKKKTRRKCTACGDFFSFYTRFLRDDCLFISFSAACARVVARPGHGMKEQLTESCTHWVGQ